MKVKYKEQEINIPEGATIEVVNSDLVITPKDKFKDGDVLCELDGNYPFIFRGFNSRNNPRTYVGYSDMGLVFSNMGNESQWTDQPVRLADYKESKPLFDALEKTGKRWNSETMQIEGILNVGDICIFWDDDKTKSVVGIYSELDKYSSCPYGFGFVSNIEEEGNNLCFKNAIRCNSLEQYKEFIKQ